MRLGNSIASRGTYYTLGLAEVNNHEPSFIQFGPVGSALAPGTKKKPLPVARGLDRVGDLSRSSPWIFVLVSLDTVGVRYLAAAEI